MEYVALLCDSHRESFIKIPDKFLVIYDSKEPYNTNLPKPWCDCLNDLQKMIIYRCLRPDKVRERNKPIPIYFCYPPKVNAKRTLENQYRGC